MSEIINTKEDIQMPFPVLNPITTIRKIQQSPELRFLIANSALINGIQYISLALAYRLIQFIIQTNINFIVPTNIDHNDDQDNVVFHTLDQLIQFIFYTLYLRSIIKNVVFNSVATLGSINELNTEFYNLDQPGILCDQCPGKTNDAPNLVIHYVLGSTTIAALQTIFNLIPHIGQPISFALGAYWKGWTAFEYPLARHNICSEHQIDLLNQNKLKLATFGVLFQTIELLCDLILSNAINEKILKFIMLSGISQLVTLFSLMHAQQVGIDLPSQLPTVSQNKSTIQLDPIVLAWKLSIRTSNGIKSLLKYIFSKREQTTFTIEQLEKIYLAANKQPLIQATIAFLFFLLRTTATTTATTIRWLFIAPELQSLQTLAAAPAIRPYMHHFLRDIEGTLRPASELQQRLLIQLSIRALNTPYLGGSLKSLITYAAQVFDPDVSYDDTQLYTKVIDLLNRHIQFGEVHKIVEAALKHCESLPWKDKASYRSFGITPPAFFLTEDPFYKITTPQPEALILEDLWKRTFKEGSCDEIATQESEETSETFRQRHFAPSISLKDLNASRLHKIYTQLIDVLIKHHYVQHGAKSTEHQEADLSALELIQQAEEQETTVCDKMRHYIHSLSNDHFDYTILMFILSAIQFLEPIVNKNQQLTSDELTALSTMLTTLVQTINKLHSSYVQKFFHITFCGQSHTVMGFQLINMPAGTYTNMGTLIVNTLKFALIEASQPLDKYVSSIIEEYQAQADPIPLPPPIPSEPSPAQPLAPLFTAHRSSPTNTRDDNHPGHANQTSTTPPIIYPSPIRASQIDPTKHSSASLKGPDALNFAEVR